MSGCGPFSSTCGGAENTSSFKGPLGSFSLPVSWGPKLHTCQTYLLLADPGAATCLLATSLLHALLCLNEAPPTRGQGQVTTGAWWEETWGLVSWSCYTIGQREVWAPRHAGRWQDSHPDSVSPDDEGDFPAPRVDEAGPAGVQGDVLAVPGTEANGRIVERLPTRLHN